MMNESAVALVKALKEKGKKIAFAESCTGGLISAALTDVPGSSAVYDGGVCSYANRIKSALLGVDPVALATEGAVSATVALQMAEGALRVFGADIAVSVTGIAGPDGGTDTKPVGTVFIAVCTKIDNEVVRCKFDGNRASVRKQTVAAALKRAIDMLEKR